MRLNVPGPNSHQGKGIWDPILKNYYVPENEERTTLEGRRRLPEARKYMRAVIRSRQNIQADFYDEIGEEYDWKNGLEKRWLPGNGAVYVEHNGKRYPNRRTTK
jgi:hypothetical protein